ncbi:hypothetical protein LC607_14180 [Nostoc sp. CHAB 5824]|nr:hypothetical protein [Nostoc sp. CHAB 5824]
MRFDNYDNSINYLSYKFSFYPKFKVTTSFAEFNHKPLTVLELDITSQGASLFCVARRLLSQKIINSLWFIHDAHVPYQVVFLLYGNWDLGHSAKTGKSGALRTTE